MSMELLEFNGKWYEPIFSTSRGSIYFYDKESGLWVRKKKNDEIRDDNVIYVGSVGHDAETRVLQAFKDLDKGLVKDFVPGFTVGREPFGISLEGKLITLRDIIRLADNEVRLAEGLQDQVSVHRGHVISEIHREFHPLEEYCLK